VPQPYLKHAGRMRGGTKFAATASQKILSHKNHG